MEITLARASLYNFLAATFGDPPTAELITTVAEMMPDVELSPLGELHRAYTRLFVGPGAGYVPPYASVSLDQPVNGKQQLWGPEATAVEARYREAGLEVAPGQPRVPDHLALELQFMQHLCTREADADMRGDAVEAAQWRERQQTFLRDHLWPWLPRFVARLSQVEAHPMYRALADFALAFIESEITHPEGTQSSG
ncbi:MAG: molecular chaperone TorD family protein [Ardenticatenaceae bacterium]|nr:molecular chaperone TorD family protein [Ardenticatenaceae bacterium]HBY92788.1 hypothetical protein [Chloroflexota bacterium]